MAAKHEKLLPLEEATAILKAIERGATTLTAEAEPQASVVAIYKAHGGGFDAWEVAVFNDCGEWDYLEWVKTPDGREWHFPTTDFSPHLVADYTAPRGQWWSRWGIPGYCKKRVEPWIGWTRARSSTERLDTPESHNLVVARWFDAARDADTSQAELRRALREALAGMERLSETVVDLRSTCWDAWSELSERFRRTCEHQENVNGRCPRCTREARTRARRNLLRASKRASAQPRAFATRRGQ